MVLVQEQDYYSKLTVNMGHVRLKTRSIGQIKKNNNDNTLQATVVFQ